MLYREHEPAAPLNTVVDTLWYCHAPEMHAGRQRVLPKGSVQIVFNLSGKALHGFSEDSPASRFLLPPAIVTGPGMRYGWVDTCDMCEVAGVVFRSGGAAAL
ncbi:MAG: DUF6597 domain-containing transcriptional factor, partial [Terriglobus sp.]